MLTVDAERFWALVRRGAPDVCWEWTGKKIKGGYGDFVVQLGDGRQKHIIAHRWAWSEEHGEIAIGMLVLHRCDNPPCVNPAHLFLGTQQDNMDDQAAKGRRPDQTGGLNKHARLSEADVLEIRRLVNEAGLTRTEVASRFGIDRRHASDIATGLAWSHIPMADRPGKGRPGRPRKVA